MNALLSFILLLINLTNGIFLLVKNVRENRKK